jgi:hypothetical protein
MENNYENKIDCKKEKSQFLNVGIKIFIATIIMTTTTFLITETISYKEKLIESFNMGKELICNTKVVSLKNGYSFDEKNETVSEGVNIFRIKNCHEKD